MAQFRYRAIAASGEILTGNLDASSRAAGIEQLQSQGHYPVSVGDPGGSLWDLLNRDVLQKPVSQKEVRLLTRQVATLLAAGVTLLRSLEMLLELAERRPLHALLQSLISQLRSGTSFADALAVHGAVFAPVYVSMVRAGESGGALDAVLARLADLLDRSAALREAIKSSLVYPMVLLGLSGVSISVLVTVVLPQFRPLFEGAGRQPPLGTRFMMAIGDGLAAYWWLVLIVMAITILAARAQLRQPATRLWWHRVLLRTPLVGDLLIKIELARFSRTLATLLSNGVLLLNALSVSSNTVGNRALVAGLAVVLQQARQGGGLARPLAEMKMLPRLALHLIRVGEESGDLPTMLLKVADIYDQEIKHAVDRLMALLVPALTIGIGLLVAAIILSILTAILSVYDLAL